MAPSQDSRHDINAPDPGPSSDMPSLGAPLPETEILDDLAAVSQLDAWLRAARPDDDRITGEADAARRLAGFCGGRPLPLLITAALLRIDPTLSVSDFADELTVARQRQQRLWGDEPWPDLAGAVAVFEMAYLKVPESAARLFRLMSVHPGPDASVTTCWSASQPGMCKVGSLPLLGCTWSRPCTSERAGGGCVTPFAGMPGNCLTSTRRLTGEKRRWTGCSPTTWA